MFGAVNTNQEQFILDGEGGDVVAVGANQLATREEFIDGKPAREITHGALGMELHQERSRDSNEKILAGNFLGAEGFNGDFGLIASGNHSFSGATNVFLAHEKVEI